MKAATRETEAPKTDALATFVNQSLTVPDYIKSGDTRGTENIDSKDIRPPALRLAQSGTPQTKRQEASFIDGLREGEFFNSLTNERYGEGPLYFVIVNQLGDRYVEFRPMAEGGGVIDPNVPENDKCTQFTTSGTSRLPQSSTTSSSCCFGRTAVVN